MDPELKSCTETIDSEASVWRTGAAACSGVDTAGNAPRLTGLKAGMFFPVVSNSNEVCDFVSAQGARANTLMTATADVLNRNATAYRNRDADTTASVEGAHWKGVAS